MEKEKKFCVFCGYELPSFAEYCEKCGKSLIKKESIPEEPNKKIEKVSFRNNFVSKKKFVGVILISLIVIGSLIGFGYKVISDMQEKIDMMQNRVDELEKYKLARPSYVQLENFLLKDDTSENYYSDNYDCKNFARDLRIEAKTNGINMCIVIWDVDLLIEDKYSKEYGSYTLYISHVMNGVILDNGSFVYIEPQTDDILHITQVKASMEELFNEQMEETLDPSLRARIERIWMIKETHVW